NLPLPLPGLPAITWYAHELIYGYSMAVIAGFLLTAVRNWTNIQTLNGRPLALLFALWLIARIVPFLPIEGGLYLLAVLDLSFIVCLLIAVLMPIIRAQQWREAGIASKLVLLGLGNACFYAGLFGWFDQGIRIGLYGGFYL